MGAAGTPGPAYTLDRGDHQEIIEPCANDPETALPVDQLVVRDKEGVDHHIRLFPGMRAEQLKQQLARKSVGVIDGVWFHWGEANGQEYLRLVETVWPGADFRELPCTEAGVHQMAGQVRFYLSGGYYRAIAKIALHYYLAHSRRGARGDERQFLQIRRFILNGGDMAEFFHSTRKKFILPIQEPIMPAHWCHVLGATETERSAVAYVQLFVGPRAVPTAHHIALGEISSSLVVPHAYWAHRYVYETGKMPGKYGGRVEGAGLFHL
jgi:hypothetical protein